MERRGPMAIFAAPPQVCKGDLSVNTQLWGANTQRAGRGPGSHGRQELQPLNAESISGRTQI